MPYDGRNADHGNICLNAVVKVLLSAGQCFIIAERFLNPQAGDKGVRSAFYVIFSESEYTCNSGFNI